MAINMKFCVFVIVFGATFCVRDSDSFKILKKLKDIIHPTQAPVTTSTVIPTIPPIDKHSQREDSNSWEREPSTSNVKGKHEDGDSSESKSSEDQGTYSFSKKTYKSEEPDKIKPNSGSSYQSNKHTTEINGYSSGNKETNLPSSYDSSNNREVTSSTTDIYDQNNNNGNYPDQSYSQNIYNKNVKTTTPNVYEFSTQPQTDEDIGGIETQGTKDNNNEEPYSLTTPKQTSSGGVSLDDILSTISKDPEVTWVNSDNTEQSTTTTERNDGYQGQNNEDQTLVGGGSQSTTHKYSYGSKDFDNIPEQSSSFGSFTSSSTSKYDGYQEQNYDEQSYNYGNVNGGKTQTTTPRSDDSFNNSSQYFDSSDGQNNKSVTLNNNNRDSPSVIPSYNNFSTAISTTTSRYGNNNLNEIDTEQSYGNSYNAGSLDTTTKSTNNNNGSELYSQGGSQHSSIGVSKQKKDQDVDDGKIYFPDHPSLNPTPEPERIFNKKPPHFKSLKDQENTTHVPVPGGDDGGRHIIDGPKCGSNEVLDKRKNVCRSLARK